MAEAEVAELAAKVEDLDGKKGSQAEAITMS